MMSFDIDRERNFKLKGQREHLLSHLLALTTRWCLGFLFFVFYFKQDILMIYALNVSFVKKAHEVSKENIKGYMA